MRSEGRCEQTRAADEEAEQQAGRAVACAKPRIDTRYHPTDIVTHTGRAIPAHAIDHPRELDALARGVPGLVQMTQDFAHAPRHPEKIARAIAALDSG